ncbi:MAG: lytic transglycosylase domain-containing protein [Alphaproteobacteria bacterium]|nr:lytic transglycosylase domain-containing protein [Alphaproteobacteria bacterium]
MRRILARLWISCKKTVRDGVGVRTAIRGFVCAGVLLSFAGASEGAEMQQVLQAIKQNQWQSAQRQMVGIQDPVSQSVYEWLFYTESNRVPDFDRITTFIHAHPDWPRQATLIEQAEKAMPETLPDAEIVAWFRDYPPRTSAGVDRYLEALARAGQRDAMQAILSGWWETAALRPAEQTRFLNRYGAYIGRQAQQRRFDRLLLAAQYTNAREIAGILGEGYDRLAAARIALAEDKPDVDRLIAQVPPALQEDPGLAYERLRWRRRHDMDYRAIEVLHQAPPADAIVNPADWWAERQIIARRLMDNKQYKSAYLLIADHRQKSGPAFAEASFLAGWLALSFLNDPGAAFNHFEALYMGTSTPISRARGAYWAGRASEKLGAPAIARQWYQAAARYQTVFYGQMALGRLAPGYRLPQQVPPAATAEGKLAFYARDTVQAARLLHRAGLRRETDAFLDRLADSAKTPEDYLYVADLARDLNHRHNAVRLAKKGLRRDIFLMDHAYPTILSRMKAAHVETEWALVHALIRQESGFDDAAVSPAGARGLMQLMPATAKEVAQKCGLPGRTEWLTSNPDYNIRLGSRYLQDMLDRYDGSYPLALAAYNGGPGRVDRWIKQFGDPRTGAIEVADWIEMIPFGETRNYVQRVLESAYVYRLKLQDVQTNSRAPLHVARAGS